MYLFRRLGKNWGQLDFCLMKCTKSYQKTLTEATWIATFRLFFVFFLGFTHHAASSSGFGRTAFFCFIVWLTYTLQRASKPFILRLFHHSGNTLRGEIRLQKSSPAVQKSSSNRRTFGRNFSCFIVDCFCFIPQQCETMKLLLFFSLLKNVKQWSNAPQAPHNSPNQWKRRDLVPPVITLFLISIVGFKHFLH